MNSVITMFNKLRRVISKSSSLSTVKDDGCGQGFKMQLLNLSLFTEEVDSLFCVTVISSHLLNPKKGIPIKIFIDQNSFQVIWFDKKKKPRILCSHPLDTITYQFHTGYKPKLYGYTAPWGHKKICLVFQAPMFSRTKGVTIREHFDRMLQGDSQTELMTDEPGCSNVNMQLGAQNIAQGRGEINTRTSSTRKAPSSKIKT